MSDLANSTLGQYRLLEAIGHGGMATVYKAYQESLDRFVAVKVLLANRDPQFAVRFKREARAIAALQHHNILPIYDYGEQNGLLYFVLQYVEQGVTLHDMLGQPIAPALALRITGHVLSALEYAHGRGVVHRDIKPANILMPSPAWALLADFGIAKLLNDSQQLTMTGFIIGTAAYMSPEQAAGKVIDARTDLYALGVVLYEMLTGRVPFDAETPMALLTKHVYEPPPSPRSLNPDLSPLIEAVLLRALAKDPNQRYQSAAEMAAELERVAAHIARPRPSSQVTSLYQSAVEAFEQGRWDEAAERLGRLVVLAPDYEDATVLLNAARAEQAREAQASTGSPSAQVSPIGQPASSDAISGPVIKETLTAAPKTGWLRNNITERLAQLTRASKALTSKQSYCPQCQQPLRPEWQICPFCRTPIELATVVTQPAQAASARRRMLGMPLWAIVGAALVLFGGAGGAFAWTRSNNAGLIAPIVIETATGSPTRSPTEKPTNTATPSPSPSPTKTITPSPSPSPTNTATPSPSPTETPTLTPTAKPTAKPTARPTPKPKPAAKPTQAPAVQAQPTQPPPTEPPPTPEPPTPVPPPPTASQPEPEHKPQPTPRPKEPTPRPKEPTPPPKK